MRDKLRMQDSKNNTFTGTTPTIVHKQSISLMSMTLIDLEQKQVKLAFFNIISLKKTKN